MAVIEATKVTKEILFGTESLSILKDVNLIVEQSDTVSIMGVSGSGKSTLLSILAGLDFPTSGSIKLLGHPLNDCSENKRSKLRQAQIGFVFQNFYLLPQFTALENVALACDIAGIKDSQDRARDMLDKVGLSHRLRHYPLYMSGGEQQRVALARAFVTHPKLIFADEPTGSLDEKTGSLVVDYLYQLNESHKTTLMMVTHDSKVSSQSKFVYQLVNGALQARS